MKPEMLFDLLHYRYASLFEGCTYAWEAITKIKPFLEQANLGLIEGEVSSKAYLINPELISIGKGSVVEPGAYIKGPCLIGENTTVRHGAYIRGGLVVGDRCVIGHSTEAKNSILLNDAHAAHFAYLGETILGNRVNIGAGTRCANLRLDNALVKVFYEGRLIDTGLRKLGALIGDDAQTGCNCVTNPGTIVDKGAFCYPCTNVGGRVS